MAIKTPGGGNKPSGKNFETFYLDGGIVQYFVKTQSLENEVSKDHAFNLIVKRDGDKGVSALVQLSVSSDVAIGENPAVALIAKDKVVDGTDVDILFSEKKDGKFLTRIAAKMPYSALVEALEGSSFVFQVTPLSQSAITLNPTTKTLKNITKLRNVFLY